MKLSILICHIPSRVAHLGRLKTELYSQMLPYEGIEVLIDGDPIKPIGRKRNDLLEKASGEYVCMIDDDDEIANIYIEVLMKAIESGNDCASLKGVITFDGANPEIFEHSQKYNEWKTNPEGSEVRYERYLNHLNLCRSSIAKQFKYLEINHGEDHDWSKKVHESGLLKTEYYIPEVIYYYKFSTKK